MGCKTLHVDAVATWSLCICVFSFRFSSQNFADLEGLYKSRSTNSCTKFCILNLIINMAICKQNVQKTFKESWFFSTQLPPLGKMQMQSSGSDKARRLKRFETSATFVTVGLKPRQDEHWRTEICQMLPLSRHPSLFIAKNEKYCRWIFGLKFFVGLDMSFLFVSFVLI